MEDGKERVNIQLDMENMFQDRLGVGKGIREEEVWAQEERVTRINEKLKLDAKEGRLGFTRLINNDSIIQEIEMYLQEILPICDTFIVLGMGGSALGNLALFQALKPPYYNVFPSLREGRPSLFITNNIDAKEWRFLLKSIDLKRTIFNVISKSGTTVETMALYLITKELVKKEVGLDWPRHFIFTTSEDEGELKDLSQKYGVATLPIPKEVGGRFSVFSAVGLLSSAVVGIDVRELLQGARAMEAVWKRETFLKNPPCLRAILQYMAVAQDKAIHIIMPYSFSLGSVADWYLQLVGESLAKRYNWEGKEVFTGYTPVKAMGATDQHSQLQLYMEGPDDKVITFLEVTGIKEDLTIPDHKGGSLSYLGGHSLHHLLLTERKATQEALAEAGRMSNAIYLPVLNAFTLGQLMYMLQLEIAILGELYHINAFDQPGVERGKSIAQKILGKRDS